MFNHIETIVIPLRGVSCPFENTSYNFGGKMNENSLKAREMAAKGIGLWDSQPTIGSQYILEAYQMDPENLYVLNALGVHLLKSNLPWSALQVFWMVKKALQRNPDTSLKVLGGVEGNMQICISALESEGLACLRAGSPERAIKFFLQALEFTVNSPKITKNLILAQEALGNQDMAFLCARNLSVAIIEKQAVSLAAIDKLSRALALFCSQEEAKKAKETKEINFASYKAKLKDLILILQPSSTSLRAVKKVIEIFSA
jgi:tetratricopeptide (TPR) repeat protein